MVLSAPLQLLASRATPSVLLLSAVCAGLEFSAPGQANEFVLNSPQPVEVSSRLLSILEPPITIPDPEPQLNSSLTVQRDRFVPQEIPSGICGLRFLVNRRVISMQ